ncbi:MAG TPA: FAD-binding domain-containing protein [Chitinophagaceae bacterium]|nr:FAD-binding domain-containing protein [Chitinophagaceae bacterium]
METIFSTDYQSILDKMNQIDPIKYGKTRNFVDGDVSYLSPYISRGVISTKQVLESVLQKGYQPQHIEQFIKELCWRDYFQRVGQVKNVSEDIRQEQHPVTNDELSTEIVNGNTSIEGIDIAIKNLYNKGYMHNHCRMYIASLACNIGKSYWFHPAKWMYYHLLDGDWASNACSWQWVAGANSNKKYFANQENINKFTNTCQSNTYLDLTYEELEQLETPMRLRHTQKLLLETKLPPSDAFVPDANLPTFIYNYYNLDPQWHKNEIGNRILLLDPAFFLAYPISEKCIQFMLAISQNIKSIKIFVGSFELLCQRYQLKTIYFKEQPLNQQYKGIEEPRDWITDKVVGYFPSFFSYWKKVEKQVFKKK